MIRNGEMVRLTLDGDVRAQLASEARFVSDAGVPAMATVLAMPALSNRLILELKYRGAPPAIFRQLVEEFALTPQAASKYRLGMVALGQVVAEEIMAGTGTDSFYA